MNQKYKIAVMGATGVGKTIFFGSYFNLVTNLGKGRRPIMVKSQSSVNKVTELITQLFQKHEVVQGTSERVDFSFSVDSLDMDVELFDVPGGFTQDMDAWVEQKILPDLQRADGVLFFISGEDIVNYPERVLKDNLVFATAISKIREHKSGELKGRSDVPICFIFTKGDAIPNTSLETLEENSLPLLNAAKKSQDQGSWLAKNIYTKGKFVRTYKSQAIGKWESPQKVPEEYRPDNVIEPMEELFEAMALSRSRYGKKKTGLLAVSALLLLVSWVGILYKIDQGRWANAQERAKQFLTTGQYEQALQEVNVFASLPLLPAFLKTNQDLETFRKEFYRDCETAAYAPIRAVLNGVNGEAPPNVTPSFLRDAEKVRRYLAVKLFAEIHPQHYEQARQKLWYFEIGHLLSLPSQEEGSSSDELFQAILSCLNCEAPENWMSRIQSAVDERLHQWSNSLSQDVEPEALNAYIDKAAQVLNHSRLSAKSAEYLMERQKLWTSKKAEAWLRQAASLPPEKSVELLEKHVTQFSPPERERLEGALDRYYMALADQALNENPSDVPFLQNLLQRYPSMPEEAGDRLRVRIDSVQEELRQKQLNEVMTAPNIKDLVGRINAIKTKNRDEILWQKLDDMFRNRVEAEAEKLSSTTDSERYGDFEEAKNIAQQSFKELLQEIRPVAQTALTKDLEDKEKVVMARLAKAHLASCKEEFMSRRDTKDKRDITACKNFLEAYLELWPDSPERETAERVRDFLDAIQGGVPGILTVQDGTFTEVSDLTDTPDIFVTVREGDTELLRTKTFWDDAYPKFREGKKILWRVDMPTLTFEAYDEDTAFDDKVLSESITPSGFDGYRKLNEQVGPDGCYVRIMFEPQKQIPECPWLEEKKK